MRRGRLLVEVRCGRCAKRRGRAPLLGAVYRAPGGALVWEAAGFDDDGANGRPGRFEFAVRSGGYFEGPLEGERHPTRVHAICPGRHDSHGDGLGHRDPGVGNHVAIDAAELIGPARIADRLGHRRIILVGAVLRPLP